MDWASDRGRALLRRAWPDGHLVIRSVFTVGGYSMSGTAPLKLHDVGFGQAESWIDVVFDMDGAEAYAAWMTGGLLPLPDPADHATWACLLADLAQAEGFPRGSRVHGPPIVPPYTGLSWSRDEHGVWILRCVTRPIGTCDCGCMPMTTQVRSFRFLTDTDDPAEALVRARIQLREKET